MRYLSVCSGIEAASVAWEPLGWRPVAFSEIESFPSAVLAHHWPAVPNLGDFTKIRGDELDGTVDLLVGGTPCQSFSVAGLRGGLGDDRGKLALEFLRLADRVRPRWLVWENVPGVLSTGGGRDFGSFLGGLGELGYGWAYRVLDAQYCGVPQRRRRVFVVGHLGDWRSAAAVLFERESLRGDPPPRREAGEGVAPTVSGRASYDRGDGSEPLIPEVSHSLRGEGFDASEGGTGRNSPLVAIHDMRGNGDGLTCPTLTGDHASRPNDQSPCVLAPGMPVRRLTPRECERLQGFPDDWTRVPWRNKPAAECPDGLRYKATGNSMAVPVMRWIGERIELVDNAASAAGGE
jgi:DNA (cytosine-5)-methyltransferase 1